MLSSHFVPGIQDFVKSVMNINNKDFVGKMEGFTMSGIYGNISHCTS